MSSQSPMNAFEPHKDPHKKDTHKKSSVPEHVMKEKRRTELMKDPKIKEFIEKIDKMHKEIEEKVHFLIEKLGYTPASVAQYLDNPKNFNKNQWEFIVNYKKKMDSTIGVSLEPKLKKAKSKKDVEEKDKSRKGKTLGSRKNWMPIR